MVVALESHHGGAKWLRSGHRRCDAGQIGARMAFQNPTITVPPSNQTNSSFAEEESNEEYHHDENKKN